MDFAQEKSSTLGGGGFETPPRCDSPRKSDDLLMICYEYDHTAADGVMGEEASGRKHEPAAVASCCAIDPEGATIRRHVQRERREPMERRCCVPAAKSAAATSAKENPSHTGNCWPEFLRQVKGELLPASSVTSSGEWTGEDLALLARAIHVLCKHHCSQCSPDAPCSVSIGGSNAGALPNGGHSSRDGALYGERRSLGTYEEALKLRVWSDYDLYDRSSSTASGGCVCMRIGRARVGTTTKKVSVAKATLVVLVWIYHLQEAERRRRHVHSIPSDYPRRRGLLGRHPPAGSNGNCCSTSISTLAAGLTFICNLPHDRSRLLSNCCLHPGFAVSALVSLDHSTPCSSTTSRKSGSPIADNAGGPANLFQVTRKFVSHGLLFNNTATSAPTVPPPGTSGPLATDQNEEEPIVNSKRKCSSLIGACSRLINEVRNTTTRFSAVSREAPSSCVGPSAVQSPTEEAEYRRIHSEAPVHVRDCVAILDMIQQFSFALFVGSAWVDEQEPLSTRTLSEFLASAHFILERSQSCVRNRRRAGGGLLTGALGSPLLLSAGDSHRFAEGAFDSNSNNSSSTENSANARSSRTAQLRRFAAATASSFYSTVAPSCLQSPDAPNEAAPTPCLICLPPRESATSVNNQSSLSGAVVPSSVTAPSSSVKTGPNPCSGSAGRYPNIYGVTRKDFERNLFNLLALVDYDTRVSGELLGHTGCNLFETLRWFEKLVDPGNIRDEDDEVGDDEGQVFTLTELPTGMKASGSTASWSTTIPTSQETSSECATQ